MNRKQVTIELFKQRFNCCQAVFAAYRQPERLDEETALKLATVFGAGVAGCGNELCGAVTRGLMALSLKHGRGDLNSVEDKTNTFRLGRQFMKELKVAQFSHQATSERATVNLATIAA